MLCPVRELLVYLRLTSPAANHPRHLFISPRSSSRSLSKNGLSYILRDIIHEAGASREVDVPVRAHSIRGSLPLLPFTRIGPFPASCLRLPGGLILCSLPFTSKTSTLSLKVFIPWGCSWRRGSRSVSSHLFLLVAGGGGESSCLSFLLLCSSGFSSGPYSVACLIRPVEQLCIFLLSLFPFGFSLFLTFLYIGLYIAFIPHLYCIGAV